ncbi:MAG: 5-formyltetrahydrofolate cyclo-ligase [Polyangiaceae bacterium]
MEPFTDVETLLRHKAKAVLRQRARTLRGTIPGEAIAQRSAAIVERLASLPELASARTIALFYPMERRHEVDLRAFDVQLRERGARIAYPTIEPESRVMTFRFTEALSEVELRGMMFSEPPHTAEEADALDAIVVPALQVDAHGHRIGYGAGFYDRTLPRYLPGARTVIVAFDFQLISEVPVTDGDVACEVVVTDKRVLHVAANR